MKRIYSFITAAFLINATTFFAQNYSGGSGTIGDPYLVANKTDLLYLSNNYSNGVIYFEQTADIIFDPADFQSGGVAYNGGAGFKPIAAISGFSGVYNGKGHKIKNVVSNGVTDDAAGLFSVLNAGIVRNLRLEDLSQQFVNGLSAITFGCVAGKLTNGSSLEHVSVTNATVYAEGDATIVGGIIGSNESGSFIEDCFLDSLTLSFYSSTTIVQFGGICGTSYSSTIRRCDSENMSALSAFPGLYTDAIGGICGYLNGGLIEECTASLDIVANYNVSVGGIAGYMTGANISNCKGKVNISCNGWCGGLVGYETNASSISNSSASGTITGTLTGPSNMHSGGLVGAQSISNLFRSYSSVDLNITCSYGSNSYSPAFGGICGSIDQSDVEECFSTGNINLVVTTGSDPIYIGGAFGDVNGNTFINNCYSRGSVTTPNYSFVYAAGFAVITSTTATIANSYATGLVSGGAQDGFVKSTAGTVSNCFWDTQTSASSVSVGGGTGETTANMTTESTFTTAGWDFIGETTNGTADVWKMDAPCYLNDGYPVFTWQNLMVDTIVSAGDCMAGLRDLYAFGSFGNLYWYDQSTGGTVLDSSSFYTTPVVSSTTPYYVVMEYNGCMSAVDTVYAVIYGSPNVSAGVDQMLCTGDSLALSGSGASTYAWSDGITDGEFFTPSAGVSVYHVIGTDVYGCVNEDSVSVTVNVYPLNTLSLTNNGITLVADDSTANYQWLDCNNAMMPISGEAAQSFTAIANGDYAVEVSFNGCVDTSSCTTIAAVGISANEFSDKFKVYPSITNGVFTISFDNAQELTTVKIYSVTGQLVDSKVMGNEKNIQFELNQSSGVYFIEISDINNKKAVSKIIKE